MIVPRIMIAGTHSGVGKTTIATGIMAALTERGMSVQGFKVGPDYIDPGYHTGATGRPSRNLDFWMQGENLQTLFEQGCIGAGIAVIEGVMGLFDGIKGKKSIGSSAHVAAITGAPVLLIMDVKSTAYSAAAIIQGFKNFDPRIIICGVILNKIGSESHLAMVKEAVESVGVPVFGYMGRQAQLTLPERHLGLVPLVERESKQEGYFHELAQVIEKSIDLNRVLEAARNVENVSVALSVGNKHNKPANPVMNSINSSEAVRIAVAKDEAFSFYYQDALDTLTICGAEIVFFSPLHDRELPQGIAGVFIGGGFPESFPDELAGNKSMHSSLGDAHAQGIPIYAECGGLMYLCEEITGFAGGIYAGVGLIPARCAMTQRLQGMGYREGIFARDTILGVKGDRVRGHEFHYSSMEYKSLSPAYTLETAAGENKGFEGYVEGNLLASYLHLNFAGDLSLALNLINSCRSNEGLR